MADDAAAADGVGFTFDGHAIRATRGVSLLQAWIGAGLPLTENVGCLGPVSYTHLTLPTICSV